MTPTTFREKEIVLVSACLMGLATRYDGKSKRNEACVEELKGCVWVPVCPEQLGGLPTPRVPASVMADNDGHNVLAGNSSVVTDEGIDVSESFVKGARMVAEIATSLKVSKVYLKARSPSCGVTGRMGVTATLLQQKGFILKEF